MKILEAFLQSRNPDEFARNLLKQQLEEEQRAKERERELAENWKLRWKEYAKEAWSWIKFLFVLGMVISLIVVIADMAS